MSGEMGVYVCINLQLERALHDISPKLQRNQPSAVLEARNKQHPRSGTSPNDQWAARLPEKGQEWCTYPCREYFAWLQCVIYTIFVLSVPGSTTQHKGPHERLDSERRRESNENFKVKPYQFLFLRRCYVRQRARHRMPGSV